MNKNLLAIFDIDGTLHKTHIMSVYAYTAVMPQLGLETPSLRTLISTYGCNTEEICRILRIPAELMDRFVAEIEAEEDRQLTLKGVCYEGVLDSLQCLHADGIFLGVCSMCTPNYMTVFLRHFGLESIIYYRRNESAGSDKADLLREILEECKPSRAVMVGDRVFDFHAAKKNNIPSIGCLYGYAPEEAKQADVTITSGEQIYDTVLSVLQTISH